MLQVLARASTACACIAQRMAAHMHQHTIKQTNEHNDIHHTTQKL